jgi:hypothetical protein
MAGKQQRRQRRPSKAMIKYAIIQSFTTSL